MKTFIVSIVILLSLSACASRQMRFCKSMCEPSGVAKYQKQPVACICK